MHCKNCERPIVDKHCGNCGQASSVDRLGFAYLLDEIQESIFQINKGFFYTAKELAVRPGHSIREFLAGKRQNHFKPIAFLIVATTAFLLTRLFSDSALFSMRFIDGLTQGLSNDGEIASTIDAFKFLSKNFVYGLLLFLPLSALATYLAFLKWQYNYIEHLAINFYITGQQMLFYTIFVVCVAPFATKETWEPLLSIPSLITIVFNFWVFMQLFASKTKLKSFSLVCISYINLFILMIAAGGISSVILYKIVGY